MLPLQYAKKVLDKNHDGTLSVREANEDVTFQRLIGGNLSMILTQNLENGSGQGSPILLISGSGNVMDVWPSSMLHELSSNHTIIIFDNRGVGNTTLGTKPISVKQMTIDKVGLLDALKIHKVDVLGFSMGSFVTE